MTMKPMDPLVDVFKALAHPARLRLLAMLREGEMCVCQLNAIVGLAPSTVSEHLTELRRAGFLAERKDGRWVYYSLAPRADVRELVGGLWSRLDEVEQVKSDAEAARAVRKTPSELDCGPVLSGRTAKAGAGSR